MEPKKILHLIATNFYGGPEKQIVEHLSRLNKGSGFKGILGSFIEGGEKNEILEKAKSRALPCRGIPMNGPLDVRALYQLMKLIRYEKIDLICAHHYKSVVMGYIAGRSHGIPVLNYSRGFTAENKKVAFYEWLERFFVKRMNGIISVAHGQIEKLNRLGVQNKNSWVVHNGVELPSKNSETNSLLRANIRKRLNIPLNAQVGVTAGRLSPEKGHRYLIEAIALLKEKIKDTCFVFCGDGVLKEELERLAIQSGVMNHIRFAGFRKDINDIYSGMDFLVLPSLTEGLPNVVLEAFSFKKPVVATRVGGVPEIIEHGRSGYIVPSKNPAALANAIGELIGDEKRMSEMGRIGFEKVKDQFSFDNQNKQLIAVYQSIVNTLN